MRCLGLIFTLICRNVLLELISHIKRRIYLICYFSVREKYILRYNKLKMYMVDRFSETAEINTRFHNRIINILQNLYKQFISKNFLHDLII